MYKSKENRIGYPAKQKQVKNNLSLRIWSKIKKHQLHSKMLGKIGCGFWYNKFRADTKSASKIKKEK